METASTQTNPTPDAATGTTWNPRMPISSRNHPAEHVTLRPSQRVACDFVLDHPRSGLFLPIGTGKTITTLEALYELNPSCHVLIVGPKPVVKATWINEIEKWKYPFRTKSLIVDDNGKQLSAKKRKERYQEVFQDQPTIYFINKDLFVNLVEAMPRDSQDRIIWPFPYVILDEAQAFKSSTTRRFKAIEKVLPAIVRLIELTGTPAPQSLEDLWSLAYMLDGGQALGPTLATYHMQYFYRHSLDNSRRCFYTLRPGAAPLIFERLKSISISLAGIEDKLPPVTYDDRIVDLSDEERQLYRQLERNMVLDFVDGTEAICANQGVLQNKLAQLASGTMYTMVYDEEKERYVTQSGYKCIHKRKLEEVLRIIESAGSPVLIAYRFRADRAELYNYLKENDVAVEIFDSKNAEDYVRRWNRQEIPVMLLHPASGGAGLNLQEGGHTLVWYSIPQNLEHYEQTNGRLYRSGQRHPVFIHHLMANVRVERDLKRALLNKQSTESALLEAVRIDLPEDADYIDEHRNRFLGGKAHVSNNQ